MSLYWKDCETLLVTLSKSLEEYQQISPLNRTVLSPFGHGTRTSAWQLLLVDVYCLQTWTGSALDHLGTLQHKAFHHHQLLKKKILMNILMDEKCIPNITKNNRVLKARSIFSLLLNPKSNGPP